MTCTLAKLESLCQQRWDTICCVAWHVYYIHQLESLMGFFLPLSIQLMEVRHCSYIAWHVHWVITDSEDLVLHYCMGMHTAHMDAVVSKSSSMLICYRRHIADIITFVGLPRCLHVYPKAEQPKNTTGYAAISPVWSGNDLMVLTTTCVRVYTV